jgi:hypothetical protein
METEHCHGKMAIFGLSAIESNRKINKNNNGFHKEHLKPDQPTSLEKPLCKQY